MNDCKCNIPNGGWCERHQMQKNAHWVQLCQTNPTYWQAWEEGRGAGRRLAAPPRVFKGGPGTELHKKLAQCGIHATATCKCRSRVKVMDRWGADVCRERVDEIVGWMKGEAKERGLRFNRRLAKLLVLHCIRVARKKQLQFERLDHGD